MPKDHPGWGGRREGAGGVAKPARERQRNRTVVTLTDAELAALKRHARERDLAIGTAARELMLEALRRRA